MKLYDPIAWNERFDILDRVWGAIRDKDGHLCDDGFVAITADAKHVIAHKESVSVTYVIEYSHDHVPVQADAFNHLSGFVLDADDSWAPEKITPLSEEQKGIVATALKVSACDVKAFDPVTPAGKVAPVRLCPMGAKACRTSLVEVWDALDGMDDIYPLSFTELSGVPFMALRAVSYGYFVVPSDNPKSFRVRITACIPMGVHRVKDFNQMVHDVFGYKREND